MEQENRPVKLTRRQEILKFTKFLFFSISAGIIQVAVFTLLSEALGFSHWISYLPALILSVLWNFTINRKFNFKSVNNVRVAMLKVLLYYAVFTPVSTWWVKALDSLDTGVNPVLFGYIVLIGTMIINLVTEFCVYRLWVYRASINTSEAGKLEQKKEEGRAAQSERQE